MEAIVLLNDSDRIRGGFWGLLVGDALGVPYELAIAALHSHYGETPEHWRDLQTVVRPSEPPVTDGSGYVVATLNAARLALRESSYEAVVRKAISFGIDTDTNAAVAGGLAGIRDGIQGIPSRWLDRMRGKELAQPLLEQLVEWTMK